LQAKQAHQFLRANTAIEPPHPHQFPPAAHGAITNRFHRWKHHGKNAQAEKEQNAHDGHAANG
jgi:hypothetical protein